MNALEPYYNWNVYYDSEEDELSPFYGVVRNEMEYEQRIYNYYISPYWDDFGSPTLYAKIIFADYDEQVVVIELIGEWNDAIENDIMYLKRFLVDSMVKNGIVKFFLIMENVINFHGGDMEYYQEWKEDIETDGGYTILINTPTATLDEMRTNGLGAYIFFTEYEKWRTHPPLPFINLIEDRIFRQIGPLSDSL